MRKLIIAASMAIMSASFMGCTPQSYAKHAGGTINENLPEGMKLIGATWEQENLWYIIRPMRPDEVPETITLRESSSWGLLQGNIIVHESRGK